MGYCTVEDLFQLKDAFIIAKWIRLNIPDFLTYERKTEILEKVTETEREVFDRGYVLTSGGDFQLTENLTYDERSIITGMFLRLDGTKKIDSAIADVSAEIDVALASGGYDVPVGKEKKSFPYISRTCKYLTLYYLLLNSGAMDLEGDKQFIEMCKETKSELAMIAEGKRKLPATVGSNKQILISSPSKIADWRWY